MLIDIVEEVEFRTLVLPEYGEIERYEISEYGDMYDKYKKKYLKERINNTGYRYVSISELGYPVAIHRLVAYTFLGIPENYKELTVNHKNGKKYNNHYSNLEWATWSEQQNHAYKTGLRRRGEDASFSTFSNEFVIEIAKLMNDYSYEEILDMYYPNDSKKRSKLNMLIQNISYKEWYHLTKDVLDFDKLNDRLRVEKEYKQNVARHILKLYVEGYTVAETYKIIKEYSKYPYSKEYIRSIRNGRSYKYLRSEFEL